MDDLLDKLVSLEFNDEQMRSLPLFAKQRSHTASKIEHRKNAIATNVLLKAKDYISHCIDPDLNNIFNLDGEHMFLRKLGVSLTYPHHSDRICIPCNEQFPDSVQSLLDHLQNERHLKNIRQLQVDDKELNWSVSSEQFSDLRLAKSYMFRSGRLIKCIACNIKIGDDNSSIKKHINALKHEDKTKLWKEQSDHLCNQFLAIYKDIWYYAEVFFCDICHKRYKYEIDFTAHLTDPNHLMKIYEFKFKGLSLKYDLCPCCVTYIYGRSRCFQTHCQSVFHKCFAKSKELMDPETLTRMASEYLKNTDTNAEHLISESDKVHSEKDRESALLTAIEETVKSTYPNARAYVFGSRLSYLALSNSDVDIFLDCENNSCTDLTQEQGQQCVKSVKNYFESLPNTWIIEEILISTRIPIMKLRHIPTNLKCDISFTSRLSVEKSHLIALYNRAFPVCRKLILFLKKWLNLCRIFGPDCITSFAISWCVIFYLQTQGFLPAVHELIKRKVESKVVGGWQCGFEETITVESCNLFFKEHLQGFFIYFANFDYQKSVICPYLGKTIDKRSFAYSDELPPEMDIYKKRVNDNVVDIFRFDSPMCIQNPIELSQNLTKAVKKRQLRCFRQYCRLSVNQSIAPHATN